MPTTRLQNLLVFTLVLLSPFSADASKTLNTNQDDLMIYQEQFDMHDGSTMMGERGLLRVKANRTKTDNNSLTIGFIRFKAKTSNPAKPMFLLAGGPGASWTGSLAQKGGYDYHEVAFYQTFADVIIVDQRGSRSALPSPKCYGYKDLPLNKVISAVDLMAEDAKAMRKCKDTWQQSLDLSAFNSVENADDINALRQSLGYDQINLVGGSYGSHLALTLMRRHPETIGRAMLRGLEGPDHSYSVASEILDSIKRFEQALSLSPVWQQHVPEGGFLNAFKNIMDKLERNPLQVDLVIDQQPVSITLGRYDIQNMLSNGANSRSNPDLWANMILEMINGDYSQAATQAYWNRKGRLTIRPMTWMMDCASGASDKRLKRIASDPDADILEVNYYYNFCDIWQAPDLGDKFRSDVTSDIPVLMFHGLWDRSTPVENARNVIKGFKNGQLTEVENGTHSVTRQLYAMWQPMRAKVKAFMYGNKVTIPAKIVLPLPDFKGPNKSE